jgi:transposase
MKQTKPNLEIRQRRCFSDEFKRAKVKDIIEKRLRVSELCKLYDVSSTSVYNWIYQYSVHHSQKSILVVQMESEAERNKELQRRIADLERAVGQKQLEIDFLNKLLELGSDELGFDLKKNFSVQLLNGTGPSGQEVDGK